MIAHGYLRLAPEKTPTAPTLTSLGLRIGHQQQGGTYWDQVRSESEIRTYWHAFHTRIERRRRKAHSINPRRPDGGTTSESTP